MQSWFAFSLFIYPVKNIDGDTDLEWVTLYTAERTEERRDKGVEKHAMLKKCLANEHTQLDTLAASIANGSLVTESHTV